MTERQRNSLLSRGQALGYSGNNLGQLSAVADAIANGTRQATAAQRRSARAISRTLSGSA